MAQICGVEDCGMLVPEGQETYCTRCHKLLCPTCFRIRVGEEVLCSQCFNKTEAQVAMECARCITPAEG